MTVKSSRDTEEQPKEELFDTKNESEVTKPAEETTTEEPEAEAKPHPTEKVEVETEAGEPKDITAGLLEQFKEMAKKIDFLEAQQERGINEGVKPVLVKDDYLDEAIMFFCFSSSWSLWGDKRLNEKIVYDEPIKFTKLYRYERKDRLGKGVEIVSVSQTVIRSKSIAKELRSHSLYGVKFFESVKKAQNVDVTLAEKMTEMNSMISSMNDYAIITRAKAEGLDIDNPDISYIRRELTQKLAKDAMAVEAAKLKERLEGSATDATENAELQTETEVDPYAN